MSLKKISKRISDAVHFFELQPQIRHFLAKIGLVVQSFCIILDVAHIKYNYNRWLVGCFGFNGPLRQYFSLYRAVSQRQGERRERIDENKNAQTPPTRTYCKRSRPLPYC